MKISVVIVTYNPANEIEKTIKKLEKYVEKILIIDNASENIEILKKVEKDYKLKVKIIYNELNIGLAKAQNIGILASIKENVEWILFLDDDSEIDDDFITKLKKGYRLSSDNQKIAMIAPNILFKNLDKKISYPIKNKFFIKRVNFKETEEYIDNVMFVISSGSLIKLDIIKEIGLYDESFFIDHIDVEYCLRVNTKGYNIRVVKEAKLYQKIGNTSSKKIGKLKFYPTNHNPKRQYTKYRNAIWTWKKYFFKQTKYVIYDILLMINHGFRVLSFEDKKKENLKNIILGIYKGIRRKS